MSQKCVQIKDWRWEGEIQPDTRNCREEQDKVATSAATTYCYGQCFTVLPGCRKFGGRAFQFSLFTTGSRGYFIICSFHSPQGPEYLLHDFCRRGLTRTCPELPPIIDHPLQQNKVKSRPSFQAAFRRRALERGSCALTALWPRSLRKIPRVADIQTSQSLSSSSASQDLSRLSPKLLPVVYLNQDLFQPLQALQRDPKLSYLNLPHQEGGTGLGALFCIQGKGRGRTSMKHPLHKAQPPPSLSMALRTIAF